MQHGCVTVTLACLRASLNDMVAGTAFEWRIKALKRLVRVRITRLEEGLKSEGLKLLLG